MPKYSKIKRSLSNSMKKRKKLIKETLFLLDLDLKNLKSQFNIYTKCLDDLKHVKSIFVAAIKTEQNFSNRIKINSKNNSNLIKYSSAKPLISQYDELLNKLLNESMNTTLKLNEQLGSLNDYERILEELIKKDTVSQQKQILILKHFYKKSVGKLEKSRSKFQSLFNTYVEILQTKLKASNEMELYSQLVKEKNLSSNLVVTVQSEVILSWNKDRPFLDAKNSAPSDFQYKKNSYSTLSNFSKNFPNVNQAVESHEKAELAYNKYKQILADYNSKIGEINKTRHEFLKQFDDFESAHFQHLFQYIESLISIRSQSNALNSTNLDQSLQTLQNIRKKPTNAQDNYLKDLVNLKPLKLFEILQLVQDHEVSDLNQLNNDDTEVLDESKPKRPTYLALKPNKTPTKRDYTPNNEDKNDDIRLQYKNYVETFDEQSKTNLNVGPSTNSSRARPRTQTKAETPGNYSRSRFGFIFSASISSTVTHRQESLSNRYRDRKSDHNYNNNSVIKFQPQYYDEQRRKQRQPIARRNFTNQVPIVAFTPVLKARKRSDPTTTRLTTTTTVKKHATFNSAMFYEHFEFCKRDANCNCNNYENRYFGNDKTVAKQQMPYVIEPDDDETD